MRGVCESTRGFGVEFGSNLHKAVFSEVTQ